MTRVVIFIKIISPYLRMTLKNLNPEFFDETIFLIDFLHFANFKMFKEKMILSGT